MTGEARSGEDQREAFFSVWTVGNYTIKQRVSASDERLLNQANPRVIEDPHTEMFVRRNDIDCVHEAFVGREFVIVGLCEQSQRPLQSAQDVHQGIYGPL